MRPSVSGCGTVGHALAEVSHGSQCQPSEEGILQMRKLHPRDLPGLLLMPTINSWLTRIPSLAPKVTRITLPLLRILKLLKNLRKSVLTVLGIHSGSVISTDLLRKTFRKNKRRKELLTDTRQLTATSQHGCPFLNRGQKCCHPLFRSQKPLAQIRQTQF